MNTSLPFKSTPYSLYLWGAVVSMLGQGDCLSAKEIAEKANLKLTGNLRRRLHRWVEIGELYAFPCYRDSDGHVETRFGRRTIAVEPYLQPALEEIPF